MARDDIKAMRDDLRAQAAGVSLPLPAAGKDGA